MRHHSIVHVIAALAALWLLTSCDNSERVEDGKVQLRFGEGCYRIPVWNAALIHVAPMFPFYSKRESSRTLLLQFSASEMAQEIPGFRKMRDVYGRPMENETATVFWRTPAEIAHDDRNRQSMHYDIWYGVGEYPNRVIEPLPGTSFFRIYPIAGGSWMVVTKRPDEERRDTHLSKDFWIGACHRREDGETDCSSNVEAGELTAMFHMVEENLALRDRMMAYVRLKLEEWRAPCP